MAKIVSKVVVRIILRLAIKVKKGQKMRELKNCEHHDQLQESLGPFEVSPRVSPQTGVSEGVSHVRCFLMVPPCGFLFLRFCANCALRCENRCVFVWEIRLVKQDLLSLHDTQ